MRRSASDRSGLRAVDSPEAPPTRPSGETRRFRSSQPRQQAIPLPAYDIRVRRELAHRRALVAVVRHVLRIVTLHVLDAAAVTGAAFLAQLLVPVNVSTRVLGLLVGVTLLSLEGRGAYQAAHARRDGGRIVTGVGLGALTMLLVSGLASPSFGATFVAIFAIFCAATVLLERAIVDLVLRQVYARGVGLRRAIIVGRASDVDPVVVALREDGSRDHLIVGHVVPGPTHDPSALGTLADLEAVLQREEPVELILCSPLSAEAHRRVADVCVRHGVAMLALPVWTRSAGGWAEPTRLGSMSGHWVHPVRLEVPALVLKRAFDVIATSVLLVVCLPLITLIAIAIRVNSRGPVFFRQRRVGLGGREFVMWKFRSMEESSERRQGDVAHLNHYSDARLFKLQDDPRITRVGRWLRRFSLDELPQLFNVMAGDMSLVGPRPPLPAEVVRYEQHHFVRLTVVPGMTGPWQVGGRNLITDFEEVVRLERDYIERWSFRVDLKIMAKTLSVMLSGRGAY